MTALPAKTSISDTYPNPSNATARAGFAQLWDAINEAFEKPELDLASATTCDIGGQLSRKLRITGTTTITSFGSNYRGPILLRIAGVLTITHNSTTLICPGGVSITTEADDRLIAWPKATSSGTSDGWEVAYFPYAGSATPLVDAASAAVGTSKRYARADHAHPTAAIGVGQSWQEVKASRAASTIFTNATGRPIMVCIGLVTSTVCSITATVGGATFAGSSYNAAGGINFISFVVPAGASYSVANNAGTSAISTWAELR